MFFLILTKFSLKYKYMLNQNIFNQTDIVTMLKLKSYNFSNIYKKIWLDSKKNGITINSTSPTYNYASLLSSSRKLTTINCRLEGLLGKIYQRIQKCSSKVQWPNRMGTCPRLRLLWAGFLLHVKSWYQYLRLSQNLSKWKSQYSKSHRSDVRLTIKSKQYSSIDLFDVRKVKAFNQTN